MKELFESHNMKNLNLENRVIIVPLSFRKELR